MLQDVLSLKPPKEIIDEAARFFTQRRIKVIARSKNSLRFALSAAHAAEAGQVKAVREATGQTRVSVETGGLSVWHIAESYIRDLRKQSRSSERSRRRPPRRRHDAAHGRIARLAGQRPSAWSLPDHSGPLPAALHPAPTPVPPAPPEPDPAVALDDLVAPPPLAAAGDSDE